MAVPISVILLIVCILLVGGLTLYVLSRMKGLARGEAEAKDLALSLQQRLDGLQNTVRLNLDGNTTLIQHQLEILTRQLEERLGKNADLANETGKQINERLDNAARFFSELNLKMGKLDEAGERIFSLGKDISSLNDILKRPKARGSLGEFFLADVMSEMLPRDRYEIQYRFKNNEVVDAVVRIGDRMLSVDSKFPLENFQKLISAPEAERDGVKRLFLSDVKKHVDAISKKYIQPSENTFDFAFMYVPSESVFYEVIVRDDALSQEVSLQEYALKKRVIPVSPNSFYAYLQALLYALKGERLTQNVHEIITQMRGLVVELARFRGDFEKVGFHLGNLRKCYEESDKRLNRYQDRLEQISSLETLSGEGEKPKVELVSVK